MTGHRLVSATQLTLIIYASIHSFIKRKKKLIEEGKRDVNIVFLSIFRSECATKPILKARLQKGGKGRRPFGRLPL